MSQIIAFTGVTLGYGRQVVLSDVNFAIDAGDSLGIVGPNGSGKTTLIRALLGTHAAHSGSVHRAAGVRFGYVPQREQVASHFPLRVIDIVLMGRYDRVGVARRPGREDRTRAHAALDAVGIAPLATRALSSLSGGQKQRTLIARALVGEPNVLVLDEPTNGMDLVATTQILALLRELHEQGLTVIMVSHALNEVVNYVQRIGLVVAGRVRVGRVDQIVTEDTLSDVYGIPVDVDSLHGHRMVIARRTGPHGTGMAATDPVRD
jgi:manganese/zinc/iron transport system ATP- binding protein